MPTTLAALPTIRPEDVHPMSPWLLSKTSRFILGGPTRAGEGVIVLQQFRDFDRAEDARKRTLFHSDVKGRPRVYRVERG